MSITATQVKELRQATGVGMMECKKALEENQGDMDKAIVWLRERGLSKAAKKADRTAAEGVVEMAFTQDHSCAVLVEINCETDFTAKNEEFRGFASKVAQIAINTKAKTVEELSSAKFSESSKVEEALAGLIGKIGENMKLRRVACVEAKDGQVYGYSHMGGKIGVLVAIEGASKNADRDSEMGKDVAMHIAASAPRFLERTGVSATEIEQEKSIARAKMIEQGKPENIIEKAVASQIETFYKEVCLQDQPFVKEPKLSVSKFVSQQNSKGKISSFVRYQLGEGIEVKVGNFAEEVALQLKG